MCFDHMDKIAISNQLLKYLKYLSFMHTDYEKYIVFWETSLLKTSDGPANDLWCISGRIRTGNSML